MHCLVRKFPLRGWRYRSFDSAFFFHIFLGVECTSDKHCPVDRACLSLHCVDPCTVRGACGEDALCVPLMHRAQCSCPQCYVGQPRLFCRLDPTCKPTSDLNATFTCSETKACPSKLACDLASNQCRNPCLGYQNCRRNQKCEVRNHKPICVCRNGFALNEKGELTCAPEHAECTRDEQCPSNAACRNSKCVNPCLATREPICPEGKQCEVQEHRAVCICVEDCQPTLSICLRDKGCPNNLACIDFECKDPCKDACGGAPCTVEDHHPVCKFCPSGFTHDEKRGCIKGNSPENRKFQY